MSEALIAVALLAAYTAAALLFTRWLLHNDPKPPVPEAPDGWLWLSHDDASLLDVEQDD